MSSRIIGLSAGFSSRLRMFGLPIWVRSGRGFFLCRLRT
jgi:hypothetical protein